MIGNIIPFPSQDSPNLLYSIIFRQNMDMACFEVIVNYPMAKQVITAIQEHVGKGSVWVKGADQVKYDNPNIGPEDIPTTVISLQKLTEGPFAHGCYNLSISHSTQFYIRMGEDGIPIIPRYYPSNVVNIIGLSLSEPYESTIQDTQTLIDQISNKLELEP